MPTISATLDDIPANGSHLVSANENDRVVVHDVELFVGFDSSIDDKGDKAIAKYTPAKIAQIIKRTREYMKRGQNPKLILGHNPDAPNDGAPIKPAIGDIIDIEAREINGAPGIVGDIEMSRMDFSSYLKSNDFPRRSAEIFPDGLLSEVALLGSQTPARPLRDTKFSASDADHFSRSLPSLKFITPTETPHGPGPGNVMIPDDKKKRNNEMPQDNDVVEKLKLEIADLKKKLKAKMTGDDEDKEKNAEPEDEKDKDKSKSARLTKERDQFQRQAKEALEQVGTLRDDFKKEKYGRKLDTLLAQGVVIEKDRYAEVLDRIVDAEDSDAELAFFTKMLPVGHVDVHIATHHAHTGDNNEEITPEEEDVIAQRAQTRCETEGKKENFVAYVAEETEKFIKDRT